MICPSNMAFMPYVNTYMNILNENIIQYTILNWDRLQIEDEGQMFTYRDKKVKHQRNLLDYYKYSRFIIRKLKEKQYDKIIIFGLQMTFFLRNYLEKHYIGRYLLDIRDHNKVINFFNMKKIIKHSALTVVSSPEYKQFLPEDGEYVINHNTQLKSLNELSEGYVCFNKNLNISYIGALRDYDINMKLIDSVKDNEQLELSYHGEGDINKAIQNYISINNISNVHLTGRYMKDEEEDLYQKSDLINVFRYCDDVNNITALPNRLYNSAQYKTPMIALDGSYMAEQIKEYHLGLVIHSFENFEAQLKKYIDNFDVVKYENGIISFFKKVINDNHHFRKTLVRFCKD